MFLSLANKWDFYFDRYQNKIEYKIKFIKYKSVYFTDFFVSLNEKWILNFLFLIILENIMVNIYLIAAIVMVVLFTQTK